MSNPSRSQRFIITGKLVDIEAVQKTQGEEILFEVVFGLDPVRFVE